MWKKLTLDKMWIIDEEATCWDEKDFPSKEGQRTYQRKNRELIELGICEISLVQRKILRNFTYLVKPQKSEITDFCTNLTGITKQMIQDEGVDLQKVSKELRKQGSSNVYIGAWGAFDFNFLKEQCEIQNAKFPFSDNYMNISDLFAMKMRLKKGMGLSRALKQVGIEFEGDPHRAIWDAHNTAKLLFWILDN